MSTVATWSKLGLDDKVDSVNRDTLHAVGGDMPTKNNPSGTPFPDTVPNALADKFDMGDLVTHVKTAGQYIVLDTPANMLVLEHNGERAYMYRRTNADDPRKWVRCQTEMEDGRFALLRKAPNRR